MPQVNEGATRRRFRQVYAEVEAAGADEDTAQAVASLAVHLAAHRHARVERSIFASADGQRKAIRPSKSVAVSAAA